jgi:hypothetical protein
MMWMSIAVMPLLLIIKPPRRTGAGGPAEAAHAVMD